jgi:hypothetical protein
LHSQASRLFYDQVSFSRAVTTGLPPALASHSRELVAAEGKKQTPSHQRGTASLVCQGRPSRWASSLFTRRNHFVRIAKTWTSKQPVVTCQLCRAWPFKSTDNKDHLPATLRNALSQYLEPFHRFTNGCKFQLTSLLIDYLPLAFFDETTRS